MNKTVRVVFAAVALGFAAQASAYTPGSTNCSVGFVKRIVTHGAPCIEVNTSDYWNEVRAQDSLSTD